MKFGGSSLADAESLRRAARIVAAKTQVPLVVVVSAMGGTTDRLVEITSAAAASDQVEATRLVEDLKKYHQTEAHLVIESDLQPQLEIFLETQFSDLYEAVVKLATLGSLTPQLSDEIASFGERLSSYVVTLMLRSKGVKTALLDSREVIVTDDQFTQASPILDATRRRLLDIVPQLHLENEVIVMGGFIAATENGDITTLGRGGSDFTASIVGASLAAAEIQIWTDVDGVMTADPSILPEARRLRVLSFSEASELAYFGARVLHPSTVIPAVDSDIPVRVLNSQKPDVEGTRIISKCPPSSVTVKSIAYKESITVVDIRSTRMLMAHGFLARIFEIFDRFGTAVDMISTSEVEVSLTIDRTDQLNEIVDELKKFSEVTHNAGQAIVCLVGDNLRYTPGIAARIFSAIQNVNIRMISQGASRRNVSFVIEESDLHTTISALHNVFFDKVDKEVFA